MGKDHGEVNPSKIVEDGKEIIFFPYVGSSRI